MKLGSLLQSLATKMKLDLTDEKIKALFALDTEVDATIATAFEQNLMTEEAALANTKIRNTIKAETLNGLDATLEELMTEFGFDDTLKGEVKKGETSFKKTKILASKISDLEKKKASAADPADKKAIQKQIDDLNNDLATAKSTAATEKQALITAHEAEIYNMGLSGMLMTKKYFSDDIPNSVHALTAKTLLEQELAKQGAKLTYDKATQTFKLTNAETGVDFMDANHKKLTPDEFIDGVLATNKLLKTTEPADPNNPKPPIITPGNEKVVQNTSMLSTLDQQLGS